MRPELPRREVEDPVRERDDLARVDRGRAVAVEPDRRLHGLGDVADRLQRLEDVRDLVLVRLERDELGRLALLDDLPVAAPSRATARARSGRGARRPRASGRRRSGRSCCGGGEAGAPRRCPMYVSPTNWRATAIGSVGGGTIRASDHGQLGRKLDLVLLIESGGRRWLTEPVASTGSVVVEPPVGTASATCPSLIGDMRVVGHAALARLGLADRARPRWRSMAKPLRTFCFFGPRPVRVRRRLRRAIRSSKSIGSVITPWST